ncbi:serine/threonine protein kinase [Azomonas agilis]|uniref:Serine/threonine protein kinase n=1 Tax=Azomonas agilis TaxID=116849 RepID=A0A562I198_9GAMM|nr:leucine-rich repeat-containing protein kinase family protein [Azomonas agilis]TWH64596.1 serine/threonine protein kinase [Azomonas agilis]
MHSIEQLRAGQLVGIQRLKLACGLTEFPKEIYSLADSLEILDLTGNALSSLPEDLTRLHKLRILFCSENQFTELPEVLGQCPNLSMLGFKANRIRRVSAKALPPKLRWLILTDNALEALPDELGNCLYLQKLMLAGNRLRALPNLAACTRLELIRVAANQLTHLPAWLFQLPRLTWLAYAGNPFTHALEVQAIQHAAHAIPWTALQLEQKLGEGASGVIYQGRWSATETEDKAVAVKLFKGAVTSDGLPQCEMAACLQAETHDSLIPVLGRITQHPEEVQGLVMRLVGTEFRNLASPPSLESCTRDVYAPETRFSLEQVLHMAGNMASVAHHLHQQGILHGDFYAHNMLHDGQGQALLGDFGAASFYDPADPVLGAALPSLEVRAFGCLLEELLECCEPADQVEVWEGLQALKGDCLADDIQSRPLWSDIKVRLLNLRNFVK